MADLSFGEQVALSLIDKVLLGAVVGVGALFANRLVERYKASQAIRTEVASTRVARISALWERFEAIHLQILGLQGLANDITFTIPEDVSSENRDEFRRKRYISELPPRVATVRSALQDASVAVAAARFWLGEALLKDHFNYVASLGKIVDMIDDEYIRGTPHSLGDHAVASVVLEWDRYDVTKLMGSL